MSNHAKLLRTLIYLPDTFIQNRVTLRKHGQSLSGAIGVKGLAQWLNDVITLPTMGFELLTF